MKAYTQVCLVLFFALSSCTPILNTLYGVNKKINFDNREAFFYYVEKKKRIDRSLLLVPETNSYESFVKKIVHDTVSYFLGAYVNDTTSVKKSQFYKEMQFCLGRVLMYLNECVQAIKDNRDSLFERTDINNYKFVDVATDQPYEINNSSKSLKIFLVFYYAAGKSNDKSFRKIFEFAEKYRDMVELRVILVDPIIYKE